MAKIDFKRLKAYSLEDNALRDYQQENKQNIYDAWSQSNSVMLQMPTGTGKTRLFVSIIKDIFQYGNDKNISAKILIMVHRTELIDQIDETLTLHYNLDHGIIQAGEKETKSFSIQLASVQTLSRRLDNWTDKEFDFIIVDEAHHVKAESYQKIIKAFPHAKLLGVTATPVRLDGRGFTDTFEELIVSPNVRSFIKNGYLCEYEYYSVPRNSYIQKEINGIKKFSQGDYAESELVRVCDNMQIRSQVVKTYLDFARGKKGIVYTVNKAHNYNLALQFNRNGIPTIAIDSDTPKEQRERYIEQFRNGEYKIICNVNLFTEGFDCPDIEFIQLARPTKSLALYLQQVGRGLRISKDKDKAIFLDNVGLYNTFGFPSSFRKWTQHFIGKDNNLSERKEKITFTLGRKRINHNFQEGNETVHLIQTSEEKSSFEKRRFELRFLFEFYSWGLIREIENSYKDIYVNGIGIKPIPIKVGLCKPYEEYRIYIKERTPELKRALKYGDYYVDTYKYGDYSHFEYRPCKDFEEIEDVLNKEFIKKRQERTRFGLGRKYHEFLDNNYSEEELFDLVNDIVQKEVEHVDSDVLGKVDFPYYYIINDFWWDATHYERKKKKPKSLDWLIQATEVAFMNTYSEEEYICDNPSNSEEVSAEIKSEKRGRRRELRKWLVDTRRGNSDNTREEHIRKWHENFTEYLTFEGDTAYKDAKIIEAAKHYGIELTQVKTEK